MQALHRLLAVLVLLVATLWPGQAARAADEGFVVIGHPGIPRVDVATLQRLYTGRAIEVGNLAVTVLNAAPGNPVRDRFLAAVVGMDSERYAAYWTVRRHVGKGVPPREVRSAAELAELVLSTPGAIGYLAPAELRPGMNVVYRP